MREGDALRAAIVDYLGGSLRLPDLWERFTFTYADAPGEAFSELEEEFFAEVNDELHHTDLESSADPSLRGEDEFRSWLRDAYARFQAAG
jgi:hypothetical protein